MLSCSYLCQVVIVLLCVELHIASGDTFYIVTSSTSPCPGEFTGVPCLTLQEYASNPSRSQNVTLLVEPGSYNISIVLTVANRYNFTMSSTNATVTCTTTNARFTFDTVENVHISGMTFQRCYTAIQITGVMNASLKTNRFISNWLTTYTDSYQTRAGGSLHLTSSSVIVLDCVFQNNSAYDHGGAIYARNSNIMVYRSEFHQNMARHGNGGAIHIRTEYNSDETLYTIIDQSEFSYNRAWYNGNGGAIYVYNVHGSTRHSTLTIDSSVFRHNSAVSPYGSSNYNGGAIYIYTENWESQISKYWNVTIERSIFSNNTARENGGAVYVYSHSLYRSGNFVTLHIAHTSFRNNTAITQYGGALSIIASNSSVNMTDSLFINNTANIFGGALYIEGFNSSTQTADSSFIKNTAMSQGGGAIYLNGLNANISISSSIFYNNSASYCGVLDVDNYEHIVNITNSVFTYNRVTGRSIGGGVACIRNASINIINSTFRHNVANNHAGVFFIDESLTTVDRSSFINNTAALDGGVFYTYVHASAYIITRSQFSSNRAGDDGGVLFIGRLDSYLNIDESLFNTNAAVDRGGVIAIIASSLNMEINRTNIYHNTAQYGGVISACNSQITFLEESLNVTADPVLSFCMLYEGDIYHFNITLPPEPVIPTQSPITTEIIITESETTQPGTTQPGTTQPGTTQPETTQPETTQPETTQPGTTQPGTTQPETTQPETTQPETTQPETTQLVTTQPGTTMHKETTWPGTTEQRTTQPGITTKTQKPQNLSTDSATTMPVTTTEAINEEEISTTIVPSTILIYIADLVETKMIFPTVLSAISTALSLFATIAVLVLIVKLHCNCKKKQSIKKPEENKMGFTESPPFDPSTLLAYSSPIYNPVFKEDNYY